MKLRNKNTGEKRKINDEGRSLFVLLNKIGLLEDWEIIEEKEPLIKDENIRKAVRAWAYVNATRKVLYFKTALGSSCNLQDMEDDGLVIQFIGWIPTLKEGETYTITELCGKEK